MPVIIDFRVLFRLLKSENLIGQGIVVFLLAKGLDEFLLQFLRPGLNVIK